MYFSFFFFSVVFVMLLCRFFVFLVATFDGLRPLLVTCHCSLCSLANKLRSFVNVKKDQRGEPANPGLGLGLKR